MCPHSCSSDSRDGHVSHACPGSIFYPLEAGIGSERPSQLSDRPGRVSANAPRKEALFFSGVAEWINYPPNSPPPPPCCRRPLNSAQGKRPEGEACESKAKRWR